LFGDEHKGEAFGAPSVGVGGARLELKHVANDSAVGQVDNLYHLVTGVVDQVKLNIGAGDVCVRGSDTTGD
jgi:hypothetical protein